MHNNYFQNHGNMHNSYKIIYNYSYCIILINLCGVIYSRFISGLMIKTLTFQGHFAKNKLSKLQIHIRNTLLVSVPSSQVNQAAAEH